MKTIKGLLFAGAAAISMVGVAQAADLPAAEPVEYVRVCDAYGAGFFFIPGTDTCLRISGYVRVQAFYHSDNATVTNYTGFSREHLSPVFRFGPGVGAVSIGALWTGAPNTFAAPVNIGGVPTNSVNGGAVAPGWTGFSDPYRDQLDMGIRALLRFDARSRTEWGVLRSFFEFNADSATNAINGTNLVVRYGFVQFGPITAGLTDSFFNFDNGTYYGDVVGDRTSRVITFAYTASFGNGISATIALEDATVPSGAGQGGIGGTNANLLFNAGANNAASRIPDLVGNVRIAQAWGTAQLSAVVGQRRFRDDACVVGAVTGICTWDDTIWAIKGGLRVNLDMLARGSHFQIQATYGEGATNFVFPGALNAQSHWQSSFDAIGGFTVDQRIMNRIDSWSVFANFVHFFTPALRGTIYGGYAEIRYNGSATSLAGTGSVLPDSTWTIGAGVQWTPVRNLDLGLEVFYTQTRYIAVYSGFGGPVGVGPGTVGAVNDDAWGAIFRIQRSF